MNVLLVGINAKYIQTNLAIRLLKSYAEAHSASVMEGSVSVGIAEWNVNQHVQGIVRGIYEKTPDIVLFSTYIWNREHVFRVAETLAEVMPELLIGVGGPEVSYKPQRALSECPSLDFVVSGEGERTFSETLELLALLHGSPKDGLLDPLGKISGITTRREGQPDNFRETRALMENLDEIPFPYGKKDDTIDPEHRIIYYESSRGCPFGCAYCMSSIERSVRFYSLERVFSDLDFFLRNTYPLVKFVDRTFNISPSRYRAIWAYVRDHYNGVTRFHFEISADLLSEEDFMLIDTMPAGSIQFEIGIQSANSVTLASVNRKTDLERLARAVRRIPKGIHAHVDLIAGLPHEDLASFSRSFDFAFSLDADVIQLGFLKILDGTRMEAIALQDAAYHWEKKPPYEVLVSPEMSYEDLGKLKEIEHVVDNLWNSGVFRATIRALNLEEASAFALMNDIAEHIRSWFPDGDPFLPRKPADLFACMASYLQSHGKSAYLEWLKFDFFMQAKPGRIPEWFARRYSRDSHDQILERTGFLSSVGEVRRIAYARSEYEEFIFPGKDGIEAFFFMYPGSDGKGSGVQCIKVEYNLR